MKRFGPSAVAVLVAWACASLAAAASLDDGETVEPADLLEPADTVTGVSVARTPPRVYVRTFADLPDGGKGTLWSSWGDGRLAANGRYYLAIGDHLDLKAGRGESRLYEFDPVTQRLRLAVNIRDVIPDPNLAGGKVHARIEEAADGRLYFATYWGKVPKDPDWQAGFRGSVLLRLDPRDGKAESYGVLVPGQGLPASVLDAKRGRLYFCAVYSGDLVAYDLADRKVVFQGGGDLQAGSRCLMLDPEGNVYFSTKDGRLGCYAPARNDVTVTAARLPGAGGKEGPVLRAATRAAKSGILYGMTQAGHLFAFDPKAGRVVDLGMNLGATGQYTAVMVLSPDDRYVYYAPGAHGSGAEIGVPVVQYDIRARRLKVLAYLGPVLRRRFRYNLGGTYNMAIAPDGGTLFSTFNGAAFDPEAKRHVTFGRPALVVLEIPAAERG